ncbi:MAG: hypothetical protein QNK35_04425, partial [Bacteroides sp.]|nr:hypothetical protein [Bacteroides sp.]
RLLGYGVSSRGNTPDIRFALLDSLVIDSTRVIIPDAYKNSIWLPLGSCDNCSYGLDPEPLPAGHVLYSDFGENRNYPAREPENLDYSHNVLNPSQTKTNVSRLTGKVIRQEGSESSLFFQVPGSIKLSGHGTFRLRVYHETEDPLVNPCNIGLILRDSGRRDTQYDLWQEVSVSNRWTEFTFDCSFAERLASYNQVWLYFSSPDQNNQAAGQTFYIDELTGPPVLVPIKEYSAIFQVKDQLSNALVQDAAVIVGQEEQITDASGEVRFTLSEGEYSYRVSHPDYESLDSSFMLSKDTTVRVPLALRPKAVIFSISSEKTGNGLANIPVIVGEKEVQTGLNGEAFFDLLSGTYTYSISHPDYFTPSSTMEISRDTTIRLFLVENKAKIKFRVYSEDKPLHNATIALNENSFNTSQTGIALFQDLTRFEEYAWSASKEGFEEVTGTISLMNDTTVNLSMNLLSSMGDYGSLGLALYPNPVQSKLFIESEETISRIEICDLRAAVIKLMEVNDFIATIDMTGYADGVYIARIYRDGLQTLSLNVIKSE